MYVYICNTSGYMLPKVIGLLLGEMYCRLLELLSLSFSILCLLICFSTSAARKGVTTRCFLLGLAQLFAVHQSSRKLCKCQAVRLRWFLKRWINNLILRAPSSQSSEILDSLETKAIIPRISSRKPAEFSSPFCSLHPWKSNPCLFLFAKETKVDHLEDLREGGTAYCRRALKEVNSSADFNLTLFYYFSFL